MSPQRTLLSSNRFPNPPTVQAVTWDIAAAAIALAFMSAGFWRLWPGAVTLTETPLSPLILKSGVAALGFVGIAVRWEDTLRVLARNPLPLVLLALAGASAIWAVAPNEAVRSALILLLIWCFGAALSLRFQANSLAEICATAGLVVLVAQFMAHRGLPPVAALDGDLAFALVGCAWAAWTSSTRKGAWLFASACMGLFAYAIGDVATFGAGIGFMIGFGLAQANALSAKSKGISIILTAWVFVGLIIGVTLFAMFGAEPVSRQLLGFLDGLGPQAVLGKGIGLAGQSVASGFGTGLGIVGLLLFALVSFATLFQALLSGNPQNQAKTTETAVWFAALGSILAAPQDVALFGPIVVLFFAASFKIALMALPARQRTRSFVPMPRQPLASYEKPNLRLVQNLQATPRAKEVSHLGLRQKI